MTTSSNLPAPAPAITNDTKGFWEGTAEGKLLLKKCGSCGTMIWYPRPICPECWSTDTEWVEASGKGKIYSFTITRRGAGPYSNAVPYALAYVELEEGPRMMTNIVNCDLDRLEVGQAVKVVFDDTGKGSALPRFTPA